MRRGLTVLLLFCLSLLVMLVACVGGRGISCFDACNIGCAACTACTAVNCLSSCFGAFADSVETVQTAAGAPAAN